MSDISNFDPNTNFADVFAESLTPALRNEFALLGETVGMEQVWQFVLRSHVRILKPTMFARIANKELISDKAFTSQFARVVNGIENLPRQYRDNPVKYAIGTEIPLASEAVYEPGLGDWPTKTKFNMYRPAGYEPLAERPEIFLQHIAYLIPDKYERSLLLAYLKWMVQNPDKKMSFALLIIGKYGVGKSWLSTFFQALFGMHNVLVMEKGERIASNFNKLEENKQVIFVDELCPDGKADLARAIEPKIVGQRVTIEPKGVDPFTVPNRYNIVAISNYETAIKIRTKLDRKWLIVRATSSVWGTNMDSPELEQQEYYDRLFAMTKVGDTPADVTDEIRRCLWWLRNTPITLEWDSDIDPAMVNVDNGEVLLSTEFNGQGIAPQTMTKDDVAALSETTIESTVSGAFESDSGPFRFELFTVEDVRNAFVGQEAVFSPSENRSRNQIDGDIGSVLDDLKCERISGRRVYIGPKPKSLWCRDAKLLAKYKAMTNKELATAYAAQRKGKKADVPATVQADFAED